MFLGLRLIEVPSAVVCTLMSHALTTEKEEIMGLLYGTVVDEVAKVCSIQILQRQDKRKDRVEVSDHQLVQATQYAEQLGRNVRVIGWYHSHPHITIQPSHVDIQTQFMYQSLDSRFFGLILSVFSNDKDHKGSIRMIGFQSIKSDEEILKKIKIQKQNESEILLNSNNISSLSSAEAISHSNPSLITSSHQIPTTTSSTVVSTMSGNLVDIHIPIQITEQIQDIHHKHILEQLHHLQHLMFLEENEDFKKRLRNDPHPLARLNNFAYYEQTLCGLLEYSCIPQLQALTEKKRKNDQLIKQLEEEIAKLTH